MNKQTVTTKILFLAIVITFFAFNLNAQNLNSLHDELNDYYISTIIEPWSSRCIDIEQGGYYTHYNYKWSLQSTLKHLKGLASHVFEVSYTAMKFPEDTLHKHVAKIGFNFINEYMWDDTYGGFYQQVSRNGEVSFNKLGTIQKGNAPTCYALSAIASYYQVSKDPRALDLAKRTYYWLEEHSFDQINNGYWTKLSREGEPTSTNKDHKFHFRIVESYLELYKVWPNDTLKQKILNTADLIMNEFYSPNGYFYESLNDDLTIDESKQFTINMGVDMECIFRLMEMLDILNIDNPEYLQKLKTVFDNDTRFAYDTIQGGYWHRSVYQNDSTRTVSEYGKSWVQAEWLPATVYLAYKFPEYREHYLSIFQRDWNFIKESLIDTVYTGWYMTVNEPTSDKGTKSSGISYHDGHSVRHSADLLRLIIDSTTNVNIHENQLSEVVYGDSYLDQNYPNPFNTVTNIRFIIPQSDFVQLCIYDITGQLVEKLVDGRMNKGEHIVQWNASNLPSGTYFYKIDSYHFSQTKKCILIK